MASTPSTMVSRKTVLQRSSGTWFVITTPAGESAVAPYPAPPPPALNLIALNGLPAAELVAIVQDLEKDNATLRHINALQKAKLEERDTLPASPFQGLLPR